MLACTWYRASSPLVCIRAYARARANIHVCITAADESALTRTHVHTRGRMNACAYSSDKRTATPVEFTNSSTFSSYLRSRPQEPSAPVLLFSFRHCQHAAGSVPNDSS